MKKMFIILMASALCIAAQANEDYGKVVANCKVISIDTQKELNSVDIKEWLRGGQPGFDFPEAFHNLYTNQQGDQYIFGLRLKDNDLSKVSIMRSESHGMIDLSIRGDIRNSELILTDRQMGVDVVCIKK